MENYVIVNKQSMQMDNSGHYEWIKWPKLKSINLSKELWSKLD